jgi:putative heme-binding domain-containing protein
MIVGARTEPTLEKLNGMKLTENKIKGCAVGFMLGATGVAGAVPAGWQIHVFGAPPELEYPTSVSAAANGDIYVSSDPNGSLGKDPKFGRIVRATDSDGDGKADKFQDFVAHVKSPRGGHFVGGTYFLIHPPYLTAYRDTNGDGVADEEKLLVEGFGWGIEHPRGADHTTNGVRMGIDGWLYVSVGDFGMPNAKGADGTRYTLQGGGVVRVRPDGSEMEPYSVMVRNIVDTAISPTLDLFSRDNTNDGKGWNTRFHHFTPMGDHGYPRLYQAFKDEIISPLADYGGGSGTGALFLDEPGFPEGYSNQVYTTDWTTGKVHRHPMEASEATFKASQDTFHELPRAIDMDVDGSSRIYLADWRNGGYSYDASKQVGLIHQVLPPGWKARPFPDLKKMPDAALVKQIGSESAVMRLEAQREILARGEKKIFADGLFAIAKDASTHLHSRVAAIFTFKQLYGSGSKNALVQLAADASVREFALRALADRKSEVGNVPAEPFISALKDPNPRVRLQALNGLARIGAVKAAPAILEASGSWDMTLSGSGKEEPQIVPHTAVKALVSLKASAACLAALENPATRKLALRALQEMSEPQVSDGLIAVASRTEDPALLEGVLGALARLYHQEKTWDLKDWWSTRPDDRGPYYVPVEWEATPRIRASIEAQFTKIPEARRTEFIALLARNRVPVSQLKLSHQDPLMLALAMESPDDTALLLLMDVAKDKSRPWEKRVEAYAAIRKAKLDRQTFARVKVLGAWLDQQAHADVALHLADFVNETGRGDEVARLVQIGKGGSDSESRAAWQALLTVLSSPLAKDPAKAEVRKRAAENPLEVGFFLAIADLKVAGFDQQIEAGIHSDNEKTIIAAKAAKVAASATGQAGKKVADMKPEDATKHAMANKGDPAVGARLYVSQGCIACHAVEASAVQKGPYLGAAGAKFQRDYLIESIIAPNAVVAQGFQTSMFQMNDGSMRMGFVTKEEDGVVEVRDIAGQVMQIKRSEVKEEVHLPQSMMPAGLGNSLSIEDFTSLIEYLVSLKSVGG